MVQTSQKAGKAGNQNVGLLMHALRSICTSITNNSRVFVSIDTERYVKLRVVYSMYSQREEYSRHQDSGEATCIGACKYQTRNTVSKAKIIAEVAERKKRSDGKGMHENKKGLTQGMMKGDVKPK